MGKKRKRQEAPPPPNTYFFTNGEGAASEVVMVLDAVLRHVRMSTRSGRTPRSSGAGAAC